MKNLTPIEGALIGAMQAGLPMIMESLNAQHVWSFQYGEMPTYPEDYRVVNGTDNDQDVVELRFTPSNRDGYEIRIWMRFIDPIADETIDTLEIDVNLTEPSVYMEAAECDCHSAEYNKVMDLGTLINVLANIDICMKVREEAKQELEKVAEAAAQRQERRSRFSVVQGTKH